MTTRLLIIDDDVSLCELLREYLLAHEVDVELVHDGQRGLDKALSNEFDLILLDVMLPTIDGFEVLKSLRLEKHTPVIMLTAKGDDFDRIFGLELGADDYISKPFNHRELLARIKALTRRIALVHLENNNALTLMSIKELRIDTKKRIATIHQTPIPLTGTEYEVLIELAKAQGEVVSKQQLCMQVLGRPLVPYDRSIDMHVSNVRKKIAQLSDEPYIQTLRGSGYVLLQG